MEIGNASDPSQWNTTSNLSSLPVNDDYYYNIWHDTVYMPLFTFLLFIVVCGIGGNVLSLVTMCSYKRKSAIDLMLMFLAGADIGVLLTTATWTILSNTPWHETSEGRMLSEVIFILHAHFQATSIYAIVYLSLERHVAICKPFYARRFCTTSHSKLAMFWITLCTCFYYLFMDVQLLGPEHWREDRDYYFADEIFRLYLDPLVLFGVPLPLLLVLNVKLVYTIFQSKTSDLVRSEVPKKATGPALNVAALVAIFILTQTTNLGIFLFETIMSIHTHSILEYKRLECSRKVAVALNSSLNFVIYCFLSSKFRKYLIMNCNLKSQVER